MRSSRPSSPSSWSSQGNLASMLSANSSMQNINGSVPNMHQVFINVRILKRPSCRSFWTMNNGRFYLICNFPQNMVNAVRRLPQIPQVGTVSTQESSSTTGGIFSKLFRRSGNNPGLTEQQIQQQQLQLQQQRLLAQQQQQLLQQGGLQSSLSQPQGLASLAGGLAGQQQQQLLAQQQLLQQGGLQVSSSSHFVPVTCCKGSQLLVLKEGTSHSHNNWICAAASE